MKRQHDRVLRSALVLAGTACAALAASISTVGASAASCPPPPPVVHPFAPWGDSDSYVLTTGGSFEPGSPAWTLSGGARIVPGNEPFHTNGAKDGYSLSLPAGSSATSPCVTAPLIIGAVRFFVANSGVTGGLLKVDVLVKGGVYTAGMFAAGRWAPSPKLATAAPYYSGAVAFQVRLTPVGWGAGFDVDDVYFDPLKSQ